MGAAPLPAAAGTANQWGRDWRRRGVRPLKQAAAAGGWAGAVFTATAARRPPSLAVSCSCRCCANCGELLPTHPAPPIAPGVWQRDGGVLSGRHLPGRPPPPAEPGCRACGLLQAAAGAAAQPGGPGASQLWFGLVRCGVWVRVGACVYVGGGRSSVACPRAGCLVRAGAGRRRSQASPAPSRCLPGAPAPFDSGAPGGALET